MEISRTRQIKEVKALQAQFNKAILSCGEHFGDLGHSEYELQNVVNALRHHILAYSFDDDLLLKLFERLDYALEYLEKLKMISAPYRMSA